MLLEILIASTIGSALSLVGGIALLWNEKFARRAVLVLVSFAVGSLIGAAFFELIPEALAEGGSYESIAPFIVLGIFAIFLFERAIHWYHHHGDHSHDEADMLPEKVAGASVILGDSLHNFLDGIAIAISFSVGTEVGIATTLAVFFHEVPQEIGDFAVLLHLGYTKSKVIFYNLVTAFTTVIGALLGYFLADVVGQYIPAFLAFSAGSFIYIAVSDLLPELRHRHGPGSIAHFVSMVVGVLLIIGLGMFLPE